MSDTTVVDWFINWSKDFLQKKYVNKVLNKQFTKDVRFFMEVQDEFEDEPDEYVSCYVDLPGMISYQDYEIAIYTESCYGEGDVPRWKIRISLGDKVESEKVKYEFKDGWCCQLRNNIFYGTALSDHLEDVLNTFKQWVETSDDNADNASIFEWFVRWSNNFILERKQKAACNESDKSIGCYIDTVKDGENRLKWVSLESMVKHSGFDIVFLADSSDEEELSLFIDVSNTALVENGTQFDNTNNSLGEISCYLIEDINIFSASVKAKPECENLVETLSHFKMWAEESLVKQAD